MFNAFEWERIVTRLLYHFFCIFFRFDRQKKGAQELRCHFVAVAAVAVSKKIDQFFAQCGIRTHGHSLSFLEIFEDKRRALYLSELIGLL